VNFGKQAGGAAVQLLNNGIFGVTVVGLEGNDIKFIATEEAIKQRFVDLDEVTFHESLVYVLVVNQATINQTSESRKTKLSDICSSDNLKNKAADRIPAVFF